MKLRPKAGFRIRRKRILFPTISTRSEMSPKPGAETSRSWKEFDLWLLWAGISPEAQEPMSHIGIYTDFT